MDATTIIQEDEEHKSSLEVIVEHISKPKKLTLPKGYVRKQNKFVDLSDIPDILIIENISTSNSNTANTTNTKNIDKSVKKDESKPQVENVKEKKTKKLIRCH